MKKHKWLNTLKEILKELSIIPIFCVFLAIALLIAFLLPDNFFDIFPTEVMFVFAAVAILAVLYAIAGIVTLIRKIKKKSKNNSD